MGVEGWGGRSAATKDSTRIGLSLLFLSLLFLKLFFFSSSYSFVFLFFLKQIYRHANARLPERVRRLSQSASLCLCLYLSLSLSLTHLSDSRRVRGSLSQRRQASFLRSQVSSITHVSKLGSTRSGRMLSYLTVTSLSLFS